MKVLFNLLGGDVAIFLDKQLGADGIGLVIALGAQLGINGLLEVLVDTLHFKSGVDPSDYLPILLNLGDLFL